MSDTSAFLALIGMQLDKDHHCTSPTDTLEPANNLIAPLTHYGFLVTRGIDSAKFLQGQTTCNVNEVSRVQSRLGAYCTAKGRMLSSFRLASIDSDTYLMKMRRELVAMSRDRLAKYIVFSKATQSDASDDYLAIGLSGPLAGANIRNTLGDKPDSANGQIISGKNIAIQLDASGQLFECWITVSELAELWPSLSQGMTLQGSRSWDLLMIRQGMADICAATVERFIPQMLNYQLIGAISFNKGCYTGQEVVARMQYKGTLKRRMFRTLINDSSISPGDSLYRPGNEQSIGDIVNTVALGNGKSEALAVITIHDAEEQNIRAGDNLAAVEVLSLPYAINN